MSLSGRWWQKLQFRVNLLFATALGLSLLAVVTVFLLFGRDLLVERDRQLVEQTGELVVAELRAQLTHAETLVQGIASAAAAAPLNADSINQLLRQQLADGQYPDFIAGGGVWPEPQQLVPGESRASLFWGRDSQGALQFYNDYNHPEEPAYFRTEWYVPVRYFDAPHCYWSRAYADPYTLVPMVTCAAPIYREQRFWGVATVDVKLAGLTQFLTQRLAQIGGYGVLLDRNDGLIALPRKQGNTRVTTSLLDRTSKDYQAVWLEGGFRPLQQQMQRFRQDYSLRADTTLSRRLQQEADDIDAREAELIARYIGTHSQPARGGMQSRTATPYTFVLQHDPMLGEAAQVSLLALPGVDWQLAIVVPDRIAVANADRLAWSGMAVLFGSVLLGLLLVGYRVQQTLVLPLKGMIYRLQQHGADSMWLDESAGFELGQLARAYNHQQQALQASQAVINESRLRLQSMMDTATDGIVTLDPNGQIHDVNPAAARLLGNNLEALRSTDFTVLFSPDAQLVIVEGLQKVLTSQEQRISQLEAQLHRADNLLHIELSMSGWKAAGCSHITVFMRDITERKQAEQRVHYMATRDSLTGLYNRYQLTERLTTGLNVAQRHDQKLAVLFIDLDHFKDVNDSLGHQAGDALLVEVAERLLKPRRAEDSVARLGGDEFAVVLQDIQHTRDAGAAAEQIVTALLQPFWIENQPCQIGASVGITLYPDNALTANELLRQADSAMYQAKTEGRNTWRFYAPEQHQRQQKRRYKLSELACAIGREQLELLYQPIVPACTQQPGLTRVSFEALLRWRHPEFGVVMPSELIPLAEESGLMVDIGNWVLEQACIQLAHWRETAAGICPDATCQIAVNISPQQLQMDDFDRRLQRLLDSYQLKPWQLRLEITESMLISEDCAAQMSALEALGMALTIDDFGTGYSSLSYLQRFPVQIIKLDHSFVQGVVANRSSQSICQAMIALAHNLGMQVVAEGVETIAQQQALQRMRCDQLQGNLFSVPLPAEQVMVWLAAYRQSSACGVSDWDI
ncbi:MAG: EAL domain-containing protein [Marinobacterium sp.]|nr:EAL domain-containing protein [Marinobacterium sp.]